MSQTKKRSFQEVVTNIVIGYSINFVANMVVLPLFGLNITLSDNVWIGLIYTGISLARGYVIRRWFNKKDGK